MTAVDYVRPARTAGDVVIRDVTVVDVVAGRHVPHRDVVVRDGRIVELAPSGSGQGEEIDGGGRFVVPGYVDSHVHVLNHPEAAPASYALMLAHGITGYRQMSGSTELLAGRASLPDPPGAPALLALCGDLLTPLNAATGADARATVRRQKAEGADFVKAAMATREGFLAAADECGRVGLPLAGHLPSDVTALEAAQAGVRCIEHLGPGRPLFAGASTCCGDVHGEPGRSVRLPAWAKPAATAVADRLIERVVINPSTMTSKDEAAALALADETYSDEEAAAMADTLRDAGVWQCPTLIRLHTSQTPGRFAHDPRLRFIDPSVRPSWDASLRRFFKLSARSRDVLAAHLEAQSRLLGVLAARGVRVLAGTDANGAGWVIPGFALHDELALMAGAGLSPLEVLRSATSAPAEFFGRASAGQVDAGFDADLVLLRSDPLGSVGALGDIEGVMRAGSYWGRDELDAVLDRCAAHPTAR